MVYAHCLSAPYVHRCRQLTSQPDTYRLGSADRFQPHTAYTGRGNLKCRGSNTRKIQILHGVLAQAARMPQHAHCKTTRRVLALGLVVWPAAFSAHAIADTADIRSTYNAAAGEYDALDGGILASWLGFSKQRQMLISKAYGNVLEVAVGTGLNLPLYNATQISSYKGVDISPGMLSQAKAELDTLSMKKRAVLQEGDVEALPFEDNAFDCVVSTFSVCVFRDPARALQEMARVVKPSGRVLLLEHSRSYFPPLAIYQDVTAKAVAATSRGCVWNQDLPALLIKAGLKATASKALLGGLVTLAEAQPVKQGAQLDR